MSDRRPAGTGTPGKGKAPTQDPAPASNPSITPRSPQPARGGASGGAGSGAGSGARSSGAATAGSAGRRRGRAAADATAGSPPAAKRARKASSHAASSSSAAAAARDDDDDDDDADQLIAPRTGSGVQSSSPYGQRTTAARARRHTADDDTDDEDDEDDADNNDDGSEGGGDNNSVAAATKFVLDANVADGAELPPADATITAIDRRVKVCRELRAGRKWPWTPQEDRVLLDGYNMFANQTRFKPWRRIQQHGWDVFHEFGRSDVDLHDRYKIILKAQVSGKPLVYRQFARNNPAKVEPVHPPPLASVPPAMLFGLPTGIMQQLSAAQSGSAAAAAAAPPPLFASGSGLARAPVPASSWSGDIPSDKRLVTQMFDDFGQPRKPRVPPAASAPAAASSTAAAAAASSSSSAQRAGRVLSPAKKASADQAVAGSAAAAAATAPSPGLRRRREEDAYAAATQPMAEVTAAATSAAPTILAAAATSAGAAASAASYTLRFVYRQGAVSAPVHSTTRPGHASLGAALRSVQTIALFRNGRDPLAPGDDRPVTGMRVLHFSTLSLGDSSHDPDPSTWASLAAADPAKYKLYSTTDPDSRVDVALSTVGLPAAPALAVFLVEPIKPPAPEGSKASLLSVPPTTAGKKK